MNPASQQRPLAPTQHNPKQSGSAKWHIRSLAMEIMEEAKKQERAPTRQDGRKLKPTSGEYGDGEEATAEAKSPAR